MLIRFLAERRSWIALFAAQQVLLLFLAWVDAAIPVAPVAYVVFLSSLVFLVFLAVRYVRETRYFRLLEELPAEPDGTQWPEPNTPFERIAADSVERSHAKLREELTQGRVSVDRQKDELLSWIHEVKTPLTALRLMIDRVGEPELKARLEYEWLRIHLLLDRQLHAERLPSLANDLHIRRIAIEPLLHGEMKTLQGWCIAKGIGVDIELAAGEVLSDAKWLAFIVRQLLANAVKYSDPGSDIAIRSFADADGGTVLEVIDAGPGIDPRDAPRLFERGFTSAARPAGESATGMGLYLARRAAETLQLRLTAHPAPEGGSAFAIHFPKENEFTRAIIR